MAPPGRRVEAPRNGRGQFTRFPVETQSRAFVLCDGDDVEEPRDWGIPTSSYKTATVSWLLFGPMGPIDRAARACRMTATTGTFALDALCCALPRLVGGERVFATGSSACDALVLFIGAGSGAPFSTELLPDGEQVQADPVSVRRLMRRGAAKAARSEGALARGWVALGPVRDAVDTRERQALVRAAAAQSKHKLLSGYNASLAAHARAVSTSIALAIPAGMLENARTRSEMAPRRNGVGKGTRRSRARLAGGRVVPRMLPGVRAARQARQTAVDTPGLPRHWMLYVRGGIVHRLLYV